jgi:hypothetical protein
MLGGCMTATDTSAPPAPPEPHREHHRVRTSLAVVLILLGTILTPITIIGLYVHTQLSDTNRYVQNVKPLASDPALQAYLADSITNQLFANVDVKQQITDVLPPRADVIAAPLTTAMETFVHAATLRVVESKQFQTVWERANRAAHTAFVHVLTGAHQGSVITNKNNTVYLDLSALTAQVVQRLQDSGISIFSKVPIAKVGKQIPLFDTEGLSKARKAFRALDVLAWVLPILVAACFAGAILLMKNRRRAFILSAFGFAIGALLLGVGLVIGRHVYLSATHSAGIPDDAAISIYDTLVRFLRTSLRVALTIGIVVTIAAFLAGPSHFAQGFRTRVRRTASRLGAASDDAGWRWLGRRSFIAAHKGALRLVVVVAASLVLLLWYHPTPSVVFWIVAVAVVLLAVIEYLGRDAIPVASVPTRAGRADD